MKLRNGKIIPNTYLQTSLENTKNDISNLTIKEINEKINNDKTKPWIKLICNKETILFENYKRKSIFNLVANIVLDDEKNKYGNKKRNTIIKFVPVISHDEFNESSEWIYILTINDKIVKIGGTRTGLKNRTVSYLCGHHIKERNKTGKCSITNAYVYNTMVFYLNNKCNVKMYAYKLPKNEIEIDMFNKKHKISIQTFHAYESIIINDYQQTYGMIPVLTDNSDPKYKK